MKGRGKRSADAVEAGQPADKKAKTKDKDQKSRAAEERATRRRHARQDTLTDLVRHVLHAPVLNREYLKEMAYTLAPRKYDKLAEEKPVITDEAPLPPTAAAEDAVDAVIPSTMTGGGSGSSSSGSASASAPVPAALAFVATPATDEVPAIDLSDWLFPPLWLMNTLDLSQLPLPQATVSAATVGLAQSVSPVPPLPELKHLEPSLRLSPLSLSPSAQSPGRLSQFSIFPASPSARKLSLGSPHAPDLAVLSATAAATDGSPSAALSRLDRYNAAGFSVTSVGITSGSFSPLSPMGLDSALAAEPALLDGKPSDLPGLGN
jgi:hypothetical protein